MFVEFIELKYKNFISFGSQLTTISFEKGLNLITGKNGGGKSGGLLDPLSFCLFGKPYRNIKIRDLINRVNKKKLYTECTFKVNEDTFTIIRTQLPDSIQIIKNGSEYNLESAKKIIQVEINRILGIDYNMFRQIIALAINFNKSFLEMDSGEKREIIESITNVKVLAEMLKLVKIDVNSLKTQVDINFNTIKILEENLFSTDKRVKELTYAKDNFEKNKTEDLEKIDLRLKDYSNEKNVYLKQLAEIELKKEDIKSLETQSKEINKQLDILTKKLNVDKYKIEESEKSIEFLNKNDICPICNLNLTKDHKFEEKNKLNTIISSCKEHIKNNQQEYNDLKTSLNSFKQRIIAQTDINHRLSSINDKITFINNEIKNNEVRRIEIVNRIFDFDLESLKNEFEQKTDNYIDLFKKNEQNSHDLHNFEVTTSILSDNGIKAYFFRKIMPILNNKINEYLKKFDMLIKIEINEFLEDKIYSLDISGNEISYFSHSEGEKKRIDISILLAFIDITKLVCNWDCSLLILDEILDSKVDEDGLEIMISSLKNLITNNKSLCAYIISHRLHESDAFDRQFRVSKASGFSRIEQLY